MNKRGILIGGCTWIAEKEVWDRKRITKLMVDEMFSTIQNEQKYTVTDVKTFCDVYEATLRRLHDDFMAIGGVIRDTIED